MTYFALALLIISSFLVVASEPDAPSSVTLEGRMEFVAIDSHNNLLIAKLADNFNIPKDVTGCILDVIAEDEYFTSYPGELTLRKFDEETIGLFYSTKALWIDEGGRYWNKFIESVTLRVHDLDTESWGATVLGDNHAIYATSIETSFEFYHYLTMGQPMTVSIKREGSPSVVTINLEPLNFELSKYARDCLKALNGEL